MPIVKEVHAHQPKIMVSPCPDLKIHNVPKFVVSKRVGGPSEKYDPAQEYTLRYRSKKHAELPHVVKFSGGRTSGMLLFTLLENGLLDSARGDVIVFNNTSAEHPDTYRFVQECMVASRSYGIPFFQIEFQTYEDARKGEWTRLPTYRLVNDRPWSDDNEDGFHWRGEVYEELLSWAGYVPNQFKRICTQYLKLEITREFLKDWLSSKPSISRLGHYGDEARIDPDTAWRRHGKNRGGVPKEIFLRKREYSWRRPHYRPEQYFETYYPDWKPFRNPRLEGRAFGGKASFGSGGVEYVAMIGLRADEPQRLERVRSRNDGGGGFEGEHVYMPLGDMSITRDDVNDFWDQQDWNLSLPKDASMSNCVFCFLKGANNLKFIRARMAEEKSSEAVGFGSLKDTPCDLAWWVDIEKKYIRDLQAEGRETRAKVSHIGFFGGDGISYQAMSEGIDLGKYSESMLPCDCTE